MKSGVKAHNKLQTVIVTPLVATSYSLQQSVAMPRNSKGKLMKLEKAIALIDKKIYWGLKQYEATADEIEDAWETIKIAAQQTTSASTPLCRTCSEPATKCFCDNCLDNLIEAAM